MNTLFKGKVKNIIVAVMGATLLGTSFSVLAQQGQGEGPAAKPPKTSVPLMPASGSGAWWPGGVFTGAWSGTVDYYGSQYLPYLYSMGLNMALLVDYADFFYQLEAKNIGGNKPYKWDITALANIRLSTAKPETTGKAEDSTKQIVEENLLPQDLTKISKELLVNTPGSDTVIPCSGPLCNPNDKPTNKEFNAGTLLDNNGYPSSDLPAVEKLITFLSGMVEPLDVVRLSDDPSKRKSQIEESAQIQRLLLLTRSYTATQSVALNNLYFLAKEREIIPKLGEQSAMTTLPTDGSENEIKDASQLQLEEFLVNRRVGNSAWYAAVNTASPIAVQRETLFVLAEVQQQLFQLRMVNERLLAAMSVMQFQIAQLNKAQMSVAVQDVSDATTEEGVAVPTETSNNDDEEE